MSPKRTENVFFDLRFAVFCKIIINFAAQKNERGLVLYLTNG